MKDLISLVDFYIKNDNLDKEYNCVYEKSYKLSEVADIINSLDNYKVPIETIFHNGSDYCGKFKQIPINFIGLENGIKEVYQKIKDGT